MSRASKTQKRYDQLFVGEVCSVLTKLSQLLHAFNVYKHNKEELELQRRLNARSVYTMSTSAVELWEVVQGRRTLPEVSGLSFAQSIEVHPLPRLAISHLYRLLYQRKTPSLLGVWFVLKMVME